MFEKIASLQNPKIKNILKLQKASERREQNLCTIEGIRELKTAVAGGFKIKQFFFCPEIADDSINLWLKEVEIDSVSILKSQSMFLNVLHTVILLKESMLLLNKRQQNFRTLN